ncbi:MAG TPA: long-chain fatty acid--CoA ligase [Bdellovibrionales bacterium]|nr:long-chain fatty acid--CoA ligase [Pseudobdellovibrionaceae bacterium]HAG90626.1 long-chain fatty acid--CoA ligase [Bdellovibrionales bacterium]|tara:strand:- start:682 stop:2412 length:1731 start_codon:yes stop_codon:yes gene_type:complete
MRPLPHLITSFPERPESLTAVRFKREGQWISWTWKEYFDNIEACFYFLKSIDLKSHDRVALFANNCIEWVLVDLACQCLGAETVAIYPNCSDEDLQHILTESNPKVIFCGNSSLKERLPKSLSSSSYSFASLKNSKEDFDFWKSLDESLKSSTKSSSEQFKSSCLKCSLDQIATVVFTSGTSGLPKGLCLSQKQVISELQDVSLAFPITAEDRTLSFLPYAHILGRVEMWLSAYCGFTLCICDSIDRVKKDLLENSPTVLIAVPRIFEKIYASVLTKLKASSIHRMVENLEKKGFLASLSMAPARILLQKKVQQGLREALGGELKYAISGGAPLSKEVSNFFKDCEVLLLEGYGLTETTGAICVNTPDTHQFGTVGKPLGDVQIKLAEDGEILVKSDKVFKCGLNSEENPEAVDSLGFLHTGDVGEWTSNGFLRITDRKKNLIKTSGGKYVAPQRIENLFKKFPLVSHVLIHGDQRKFIVALIALDPTELKEWALRKNIPFSKVSDLPHAPQVQKKVSEIVREVNGDLASFESIKKFHILDRDFSIEEGELTPSLKLRRKVCEAKYKSVIDQLYGM